MQRKLPGTSAGSLALLAAALAAACAGPVREAAPPSTAALVRPLVREGQPSGRAVQDWLVCGEFPASPGLEQDHLLEGGGEAGIRPVEGLSHARPDGTRAEWFRVHGEGARGHQVDLRRLFAGARPVEQVVGYAHTTFLSTAPEALLVLDADGPWAVWLNGREVARSDPAWNARRAPEPIPVALESGPNRLLVKVASGGLGRWEFSLRICNDEQVSPSPESGELFLLYGQPRWSRDREDVLIRHFFAGHPPGVFLDVGCGHFRQENNTYALEHDLGWSGLAVDALAEFAQGYEQHRPRTRFFSYLVSDQDTGTGDFYRAQHTLVSSTDKQWAENEAGQHESTELEVPNITLTRLLEEHGVERLTFLSMDIELAEPAALAGFDIERFKPQLVCIEANDQVADQIAAYFTAHRYERIHAYVPFDAANWYFKPID